MPEILLLGSTGLLGQAIAREARLRGKRLLGVARSGADFNLDIRKDEDLTRLIETTQPDIVINTCAIVNHALCEDDKKAAYEINSRPNAILAQLARQYGFYLVFISTDGYYSGDTNRTHAPTDPVLLMNEYARTKFAGECFALTAPQSLVLRTNIVGFRGRVGQPTFVEWAIQSLKEHKTMTLFDDYFTSSITVTQFAQALFDLLPHRPTGIFNLASSEVSSKAQFITQLALALDLDLSQASVGSVKSLTSSQRADSLGLDVSRTEALLGYALPGLAEVISQIKGEYHELEH